MWDLFDTKHHQLIYLIWYEAFGKYLATHVIVNMNLKIS